MDLAELFLGCRKGDLAEVRYLVEKKAVDLNVRDNWDSTPLYYACLCGHEDVVKYLLENGARCEANTFDGERCLYGSLNSKIRNLLKSFKVVTSKLFRRDIYEEFLRRLLEDSMYADITYFVQEEKFPTHRCILSARSEYFAEMFQSKWKDKDKIYLKNKLVLPLAFKSVLQYLYTGRLETLVDNVQDCVRVARQCRLPKLLEQIESNLKETFYFESSKPGVRVTTLCIESLDKIGLRADFGFLAGLALPKELRPWVHGELPFEPECFPTFADIGFIVEGHRFLCHKAFFCGRSDYFEALLSDHFGENDLSEEIPCVTLHDITVDIFTQVIYYIYQDTCELCSANAYDTLCTADLYLLHGLKRQCASWIANHLEVNNVVPILKSARVFNLHQLQDCCMKFIADNIHEVIHLNEFADLVQYDAAVVNEREETDSIEIIDEIRYYITNFVQTFSKMEEANEKLQLIDDLLEQLNLVC